MAQQYINYGNTANDGTGDPLRDAFIKVDENFDQIWAAGPVGSNVTILNNSINVTNTNGNLILNPNGVGIIQTNRHLYPRLDNTYTLGQANLRYRGLYVGADGITTDGNLTLGNIANLHIPGGQNGYVIQTNGAGNLSWTAQTGSGNGNPGGTNTQVQFNDGGLFGGSVGFTFNKTSNLLSVPGNVTASFYIGDGSQLANIPVRGVIQANVPPSGPTSNTLWWDEITGRLYVWYTDQDGSQWVDAAPAGPTSTYGNSNVSSYLAGGTNTAGINTSGNITADYFLGDGGQLSNISVGSGTKIVNGSSYANIASANGNLEININANSWIFDTAGNLTLPGNTVFQTPSGSNANINFHPDGSGIVNIKGGNQVLLLVESDIPNRLNRIEVDTFGTANVFGGTFSGTFARGTDPSNLQAVLANDRLAGFKAKGWDGQSYSAVTGQITIEAHDDWNVGNTPTQLSFWTTSYANANPVVNMRISPTGNVDIYNGNLIVTGGGGYLQGNVITGNDGLYAGIPEFTPLGSDVVAQFGANVNSYSQVNFQNINPGNLASGDYIITADNGTDSTYYLDMGIASSNHTDPDFFGDTSTVNDAYIYVTGNDQAGPSSVAGPGNLILGSTNGAIKMFVGNTAQANVVATVSSNGMLLTGNVTAKTFVTTPVALANLTAVAGARAFVSDGNLAAAGNFGAQIGNAGSNVVPVYSDGANWYIG